jgi:hypothetical protein
MLTKRLVDALWDETDLFYSKGDTYESQLKKLVCGVIEQAWFVIDSNNQVECDVELPEESCTD